MVAGISDDVAARIDAASCSVEIVGHIDGCKNVAHEAESMALEILVIVVTHDHGRLAGVVRDRFRLRGKIKTLTAEGRMQAGVLLALPKNSRLRQRSEA